MFTLLLFWLADTISPPDLELADLYIPVDTMDYLAWLIIHLDVNDITELSYQDYSVTVKNYLDTFENLFVHIECATKSVKYNDEMGWLDRPIDQNESTIIELRYGCKRDYNSFQELVEIFFIKTLIFIDEFLKTEEYDRPYFLRRWGYVIDDCFSIINTLYERKLNDTLLKG